MERGRTLIGRGKISKPIPVKYRTDLTIEFDDLEGNLNFRYELDEEFVHKLRKAVKDNQKIYLDINFQYYE